MSRPAELVALERTELALADAIALIGIQLDDDDSAAYAESLRIVAARDGEDFGDRLKRIARTLNVATLLASAAFDLAGGLITDDELDARGLVQRYALRLASSEMRRLAIACRVQYPGVESSCPRCGCAKSGELAVANALDERCPDFGCVCHSYREPDE